MARPEGVGGNISLESDVRCRAVYISRVQIGNYKSYYESPVLELKPGFNIIVGKNNSGKTALLEALGLKIQPSAHRSPKTLPAATTPASTAPSWVEVQFSISRDELMHIFREAPDLFKEIHIAVPERTPQFGSVEERDRFYSDFVGEYFSAKTFTSRCRFEFPPQSPPVRKFPSYPAFGGYCGQKNTAGLGEFLLAEANASGITITSPVSHTANLEECDFGQRVVQLLTDRLYCFKAERFSPARSRHGTSRDLARDASNLAEVLAMLQGNPARFQEFNRLVHMIMDDVQSVSVQPAGDQWLRILVWPAGIDQTREDLASELDQSGSGVAQVLSIFYVAMTAPRSQTIIIDEPQSFLHPGAVRKLLEALKSYPQHQYIVASHSPISLTATNPHTITMVRKQGSESTFESIDPQDAQTLRACLAEVGARLSDVFGADRIIWVEGQTEELCFPKILEQIGGRNLQGTVIRGMKNTGDLIGKHARLAADLYKKLSGGDCLLPPALRFIFDKETRSGQEMAELQRLCDNKVSFLGKRMYESYLLNPTAISAVCNGIDGFRKPGADLDEKDVTEWLSKAKAESKYGRPATEGQAWDEYGDAAKLLGDLFSNFSDTRVEYTKTTHSVVLTDWLIENSPGDLSEIAELLATTLDDGESPR